MLLLLLLFFYTIPYNLLNQKKIKANISYSNTIYVESN